ncbi:unnamed protein product [Echinostoma caproni]|uniref:MMS19 nucleotide excision repair protein n=1 Tax=Echinostoma caproni TaxID=27848 RepID=A0A183AKJ5_9TREM|nr:unnamed protein product [Echinostoma caproni]
MLSLVESLETGLVDTRTTSQRDALKKLVGGLQDLPSAQIQTTEGLVRMQKEFLMGYLQAVDGERDPENLLLIFEMNPIVMKHFPVDEVKDDFFEIMSVYFPIDFSPPPGGGTLGVTREALATRLHHCLFASRLFAAHQLLPLLCEKADADWSQGRLDALSLLADILHGRVLNPIGSESVESAEGKSVPLNHVSSYLVLIIPLLEKIAVEKHQLKDFAATTCRILGLRIDPTNDKPMSIDVTVISEKLLHVLSQTVRYTASHRKLTQIFLVHLLNYFGSPLVRDCSDSESIDKQLTRLQPWCKFFRIACQLMDAALEDGHFSVMPSDLDDESMNTFEGMDKLSSQLENLVHQIDVHLSIEDQSATLFVPVSDLICFCPFGLVLRMHMLGLFRARSSTDLEKWAVMVCRLIRFIDEHLDMEQSIALIRCVCLNCSFSINYNLFCPLRVPVNT